MATFFRENSHFRSVLDRFCAFFSSSHIDLPVAIVLTESAFEKIRESMIEEDEASISGVDGRVRRTGLVTFGTDDGREFFQYRGFRFFQEQGVDRDIKKS